MKNNQSFEQTYSLLIDRLSKGERPHLEFSEEFLEETKNVWEAALSEKNLDKLDAIMCVLEHARHPSAKFDDLFFLTLEEIESARQIIFTLGASWKHLLGRWSRSGDRIPMRYIEILRKLLTHSDVEVREWALRTIDQIGPQGRMLQKEVYAAKIGWRGLFNPHAKAVSQLVEMFEKRWSAR